MKIVKNLGVAFPIMYNRGADFDQIVLHSKKIQVKQKSTIDYVLKSDLKKNVQFS